MDEGSSNSSTEGGNISCPPPPKKQISPAICWCLTLNNYTDEEVSAIVPMVKEHCRIAAIGYEIGEKCGTPHLQGYVEFKVKVRPLGLFNFTNRIIWAKAKKKRGPNVRYCSKDANMLITLGLPKPIKVIEDLRPFQQEILDICMEEPDDRSIYWFWDEAGNIGKTQFMKYMCVKHNALPCVGGKFADIMNLIFNANMDETRTIIFNVPRGHREHISYSSLEAIKDGLVVNTKYETGFKVFNSPHVIVFANFPPDTSSLSADRWVVKNLGIEN